MTTKISEWLIKATCKVSCWFSGNVGFKVVGIYAYTNILEE